MITLIVSLLLKAVGYIVLKYYSRQIWNEKMMSNSTYFKKDEKGRRIISVIYLFNLASSGNEAFYTSVQKIIY